MIYYFKKGKNANETKNNCAVYGEGAVTDRMCQKWTFAMFVGNIYIMAKKFFAVGVSYALQDV